MTERAGAGAWTEPGAHPVHPGVHRIPLPLPEDGLRAVNVYAIEEPDGLVLIDSGWAFPGSVAHLERALAGIGHDLGDVARILVTHVHRDHYTQAVELRRLVGSRVALGIGERLGLELLNDRTDTAPVNSLAVLRRGGADEVAERVLREFRAGDFDRRLWEFPDEWLQAGLLPLGSRSLRVIPTPGHTRGHVVFLDAEAGLLFAGDHVLPHITPSIGFELAADRGLPLGNYLDSLHLMTTFADARLLPAHGPVTASVQARVGDLLAHHDNRLQQSHKVVSEGAATGYQVARRLTWTRGEIPFADLNLFNQMLAVTETVAHLDVLVARGTLSATDTDGVRSYAEQTDPVPPE